MMIKRSLVVYQTTRSARSHDYTILFYRYMLYINIYHILVKAYIEIYYNRSMVDVRCGQCNKLCRVVDPTTDKKSYTCDNGKCRNYNTVVCRSE